MADNPGVAERLRVMGFSEAVVQDIAAEVPTVQSARAAFATSVLLGLPFFLVAQALSWSILQILGFVVWGEHLRACGDSFPDWLKIASVLQFFATVGWFGLLAIGVSSRMSRNWQMRFYASSLFNLYWGGVAPGLAQRILSKHPECQTADDFRRVSMKADQRWSFRIWAGFQTAAVVAFFLVPAAC
ncbi:MAG: hypothetical protein RLO80_07730 [Hyphomonas sp.]